MNIKKELKIIYLSAGIFFIILIFLVTFPLLKSIENSYSDEIKTRNDMVNYKNQEKKYTEFVGQYSNINTTFDDLFIDKGAPIEIIEFWEKIASEDGVSIEILANGIPGQSANGWNYMSFTIRLGGSFKNITKVLEKIEKEPYLGEISKIAIQKNFKINQVNQDKSKEDQVIGEVKANLFINVYVK